MSNPYFKFKQFTVYHDLCAMKVGTDGVLLGAWTNIGNAQTILDIGTGTGLIALMLAQRNKKAHIDAIDICSKTIEQAKENIRRSPFSAQINCIHSSLCDFAKQNEKRYDVIASNPPFFIQSLKSPDRGRNLARHTDCLPIDELITSASELLSEKGKLSLIFPFEYRNRLISLGLENNLFTTRITNIFPTPDSTPKRLLIEFSKIASTLHENELIIEKERHVYSDDFQILAKDFYLKL